MPTAQCLRALSPDRSCALLRSTYHGVLPQIGGSRVVGLGGRHRSDHPHNEESEMTEVLPAGSLEGKVALVTGSSRGIGADTIRYFAEAGADVVINFRNKAPRAEKLAGELRALGRRVLVVGADLTDPASVAAMFDSVRREFGRLDVLVLNASGGMESGMAEDYALALNRDAQVGVLQAAEPLMGEGARVVFVTSHQAHFIRTT